MRDTRGHARWVRVSHGIVAASLLVLAATGFVILMAHPRLYWGETGNDLTPALLELPISRNHRHGGFTAALPVADGLPDGSRATTAIRTYDIFNQNGWGRSLHFLAAWCLVLPGVFYLVEGLFGGHFRARLWPSARELRAASMRQAIADHARLRVAPVNGEGGYNVLQKLAYTSVVFGALPLVVLTGLAMSPAIGAALPWLPGAFGGYQSARTIHFAAFAALVLFVVVHLVMVVVSGFRRQVKAITWGG
jgi:thiosulfate reductase cytochrome b subunit